MRSLMGPECITSWRIRDFRVNSVTPRCARPWTLKPCMCRLSRLLRCYLLGSVALAHLNWETGSAQLRVVGRAQRTPEIGRPGALLQDLVQMASAR